MDGTTECCCNSSESVRIAVAVEYVLEVVRSESFVGAGISMGRSVLFFLTLLAISMEVFRRDRGAHIGRFASHLSAQPIYSNCPLPSLELLLKPAKR